MKLDHFTLRTLDLEPMKDFFCDVLGLQIGDRPPFRFPGYWLYAKGGSDALVHLVEGRGNSRGDDDPGVTEVATGTGAVDHVAFKGDDRDGLVARLDDGGWTYRERELPDGRARQIFIDGPEQVVIEVVVPNA